MWCVFLVDISFLLTVKHDPTDKDDKIAIIMNVSSYSVCECCSVFLLSVCFCLMKTFASVYTFESPMFKWTDFVVFFCSIFNLFVVYGTVHTWHHQKLSSCSLKRILWANVVVVSLSLFHSIFATHKHATLHMTLITQYKTRKRRKKKKTEPQTTMIKIESKIMKRIEIYRG